MDAQLNDQIRDALQTDPHVESVQAVRSFEVSGAPFVGVRVGLKAIASTYDLMPVLANIRSRIRQIVPTGNIFIEPDITEGRGVELPTEAIVIRSAD